MKQASFSAQELFAMAYLMKKRKMYGIPDAMGADRNAVLQAVLDGLVIKGIADMDIDGHIAIRPEYYATVNTICDCQKCLTVSVRTEAGAECSYLFWLWDDEYTMAEVVDDRYIFTPTDPYIVDALIAQHLCGGQTGELPPEVTIPQLEIVKAKRACVKGDYDETTRILRQNGASSGISHVIAAGLRGDAYFLSLGYMDMQTEVCEKQDLSFICSEGVLLSLGQTVANLRTCATFTPIQSEDMYDAVKSLVHRFLKKREVQQ